jgi:hypothetical protein
LNLVMVDLVEHEPRLNPRYLWGTVHALHLAQQLEIPEIALLEFGTGRGDGARGKQYAADRLRPHFGVSAQVHTFDIGTGIPDTKDVRDLPSTVVPGGYADFDPDVIRAKIAPAVLHLGTFEECVRALLSRPGPPVGYVEFDAGTYTGAVGGLTVLREAPDDRLLPRVHCLVGGICGFTSGEHNGPRLAVAEHNDAYPRRPVSRLHGLRYGYVPRRFREQEWVESYFMAHILDHPLYPSRDGLFRNPLTAAADHGVDWDSGRNGSSPDAGF